MCCLNVVVSMKSAFGKRNDVIDVEPTNDSFFTDTADTFIAFKDNLRIDILYELVALACSAI